MSTPAHWYTVPKGEPARDCKSCGAEIYWTTNANGKRLPIDCDADGAYPPTAREDGYGISHFRTCSNPAPFSHRAMTDHTTAPTRRGPASPTRSPR